MALNRGRLFAGALFAGALFGGVRDVAPPDVIAVVNPSHRSPPGGPGYWESGRTIAQPGHTWVKFHKPSRFRVGSSESFVVRSESSLVDQKGRLNLTSCEGWTHSGNRVQSLTTKVEVLSYKAQASGHASPAISVCSKVAATTRDARVEWLSIDELLMLLEVT